MDATSNVMTSIKLRHRVLSILGCWLINLPNGMRWLLGNLTVYTSSYFFAQGGHTAEQVNTPWTLSIAMVAWAAGVFISAPLIKYLGNVLALVIGNILFSAGIVLAYISLNNNSITGFNLSFGVVTGVGNGIIETVLVMVVSELAGKYQGLCFSLVSASHIFGSIANNQIATWYINPSNFKPTLKVGASTLFTQWSVIERTPSFFIILLFLSISFHSLGMFLIHNKKSDTIIKLSSFSCCHKLLAKTSSEERVKIDSPELNFSSVEEKRLQTERQTDTESKDMANNMTPRQVLQTTTFYALWFGLSFAEFAKIWLFDYYKIFGIRTIPDDHFLTNLGTFMALITALSRPFWGWSMDHLGGKSTLILLTTSVTLMTAFFYFTPLGNRWVYAISALAFGASVCGYSIVAVLVTVRLYGKINFSVNFGLICMAYVVTNLIAPLMFQSFIDQWGWFPLLFTFSVTNAICIVVHMTCLLRTLYV